MNEIYDSIKEYISKFINLSKSEVNNFLNSTELDILYNMRLYFDDNYYNSISTIDDWKYDLLNEFLINTAGKSNSVGFKIRDNEIEVKLPYWLGSLDKIKNTEIDKLNKWIKNNLSESYIISDKLDGISCLLVSESNSIKLYTRGNGSKGKDITYIKEYINFIPKKLPTNLYIRGELVISKYNFKNMDPELMNPRNTVSGLVKSKKYKIGLKYVDFVAYEIINFYKDSNNNYVENQLEQFKKLSQLNFRVVQYNIVEKIDINILENILENNKKNSYYEMDGIVIQKNTYYLRNTSNNPNYAFAFKNDTFIETKVLDVEWNITMSGMLKPRVKIEPVNLSGAIINYATGYNASFIYNNKIGKNSIVLITRSGEVIPKIVDVIKPSEFGPLMPLVPYKWGDTNVDIYQINNETNDHELLINDKLIINFMSTLNIKYINEATVKKITNLGFDTIYKILNMSIDDFKKIDGFKDKSAIRAYNNIHDSLKNIDISNLMVASNCFGIGIGIKKIELINFKYPDLYINFKNYNDEVLLNMLIDIDSISNLTANKIIKGFYSFDIFYNSIKDKVILISNNKKDKHVNNLYKPLDGKKIVCSGFRTLLDDCILSLGGILTDSVTKNTYMLIYNGKNTSKVEKAKSLNILILTIEEFKTQYNL